MHFWRLRLPADTSLQLRDELGNPLDDVERLRVCLQRGDADPVYATMRSASGGWYRGTYCVTKAGPWAVAAEAEGVVLSPPLEYVVVLPADASARHSAVVVRAASGDVLEWEVVLRDAYGNHVCDAVDGLVMEATAGGRVLDVVQTMTNGVLVGSCTLSKDDLAVVDVTVDGARLAGCPVGVDRRCQAVETAVEDWLARWKDVETDTSTDEEEVPAGVPVVRDLRDLWLLGRLLDQ